MGLQSGYCWGVMYYLTDRQVAEFWRKIDKKGDDECWEWKACKNQAGYGIVMTPFGTRVASRVAWTLAKGNIPENQCVCHTCDNPACCNPAHFFLGTRGDNNRDAVSKGRNARGEKMANAVLVNMKRGEQRAHSKLNAEQVTRMRELRVLGASCRELGEMFGVCAQVVSRIVRRKVWTHI